MVDHSKMKLGKGAPRPFKPGKMLMLSNYIDYHELPPPLEMCNWNEKVARPIGQGLNDVIGDCTIVAVRNAIKIMTANVGTEVTVLDAVLKAKYSKLSGYVDGNPETDTGLVIADVLDDWVHTGLDGYTIDGWVAIEPGNLELTRIAIDLFGWVDLGLQLPLSAQNQENWSVVSLKGVGAPGGWGGHSVICGAHNIHGFAPFSWGEEIGMSYPFFSAYCDEAYTGWSPHWINKLSGKAPSGVALADLIADSNSLKHQALKRSVPIGTVVPVIPTAEEAAAEIAAEPPAHEQPPISDKRTS